MPSSLENRSQAHDVAPRRGRNGKANVTRGEIQQMHNLKAEGVTNAEIARRIGRSQATVEKYIYGKSNTWYRKEAQDLHLPPPKRLKDLDPEAREAIEDFRVFRNRYFKRDVPSFQQEVCNSITSLTSGQALVAMWPPGFGKTTLISHDYVMWRMLRARCYEQRFACLLISKTANMARAFLRRLRGTMEVNKGLQEAYGWMKPENPDRWTEEQLRVDGFDLELMGKECNFIAAGMDSQIYGWRVELIICDDLVDKSNATNIELTDKLQAKFHEEVESRLESGGSLSVCGTRFSMNDLYGRLINLRDEDTGEQMYKIVQYPAHNADRCPGKDGPHDEYPEGCHLWPAQKSYRWLMRERQKMGTARFDFVYNQVESSSDENLIRKEWVDACKDHERVFWALPKNQPLHVICTLDPSPTQYACAQAWAYNPDSQQRYLIAYERKRMTVSDMIQLIEDWTLHLRDLGKEPKWVFEQNAAQRWLFQSLDYKLLRQRIGVRVLPHNTGRNKADPDYGVQILGSVYEFQRVSLPWGSPEVRNKLEPFITELITYPNGQTDDGPMAQWFFEWNIRKLGRSPVSGYYDPKWAPDYLKDSRKIIPINRKESA